MRRAGPRTARGDRMMRRFAETSLVVATHNTGKLDEFRALLSPYGVSVTGNADHGLPEPEETEQSFVGNARIKARAAVAATGLPALADDSGLEVFDLDGVMAGSVEMPSQPPNHRHIAFQDLVRAASVASLGRAIGGRGIASAKSDKR